LARGERAGVDFALQKVANLLPQQLRTLWQRDSGKCKLMHELTFAEEIEVSSS